EDGIRDFHVTGVQTCALPILAVGQFPPVSCRGRRLSPPHWKSFFSVASAVCAFQPHPDAGVCGPPRALPPAGCRPCPVWPPLPEIGRASCRERVWVWVGEGSV